MSRFPLIAFLPAVLAVAYAGCSSTDSTPHAPAAAPLDPTVAFEGGTNAAGLAAISAAVPTDDATQGAVFDAPADNSELGATPVAFVWHIGASARRESDPSRRFGAWDPTHSREPSLLPAPAKHAWLSPLRELFGGERSALAASTSMNGTATLIYFSTAVVPTVFRVFTTETSYLPDAAAWKTLDQGTWVTAQLITATFANDVIVPGGGPFNGGSIKFCVDMN